MRHKPRQARHLRHPAHLPRGAATQTRGGIPSARAASFAATENVVRTLAVTSCQVSSQLLHARMRHYETSTEASLFLPDFLAIVEGGMVLTSNQLGFIFTTGEAVTLDLPKGWTPVLRRRAFSYAMH